MSSLEFLLYILIISEIVLFEPMGPNLEWPQNPALETFLFACDLVLYIVGANVRKHVVHARADVVATKLGIIRPFLVKNILFIFSCQMYLIHIIQVCVEGKFQITVLPETCQISSKKVKNEKRESTL